MGNPAECAAREVNLADALTRLDDIISAGATACSITADTYRLITGHEPEVAGDPQPPIPDGILYGIMHRLETVKNIFRDQCAISLQLRDKIAENTPKTISKEPPHPGRRT